MQDNLFKPHGGALTKPLGQEAFLGVLVLFRYLNLGPCYRVYIFYKDHVSVFADETNHQSNSFFGFTFS